MVIGAFFGSFIVMNIMLYYSYKINNISSLLVIGSMIGYFCSAIVGILIVFSDDENIANFTKWSMGSFSAMTWEKLIILAVIAGVFIPLAFLLSKDLNALLIGEAYSKTMGVNIKKVRMCSVVVSSVLTATVTAFVGLIGFVGLSVPHICRMLFKTSDNRILIPASVLVGAILGVICDLLARTIASPTELAIGNITSFIGVPIVIMLITKKRR